MKMESIYGQNDDYYGKCAEVFLTINGNIAFHCTLCEKKYKNFCDYNDHLLEIHYQEIKLTTNSKEEEEGSPFDPLKEDCFSIASEDFIIEEYDDFETFESPEEMHQQSLEQENNLDEEYLDSVEDCSVSSHSSKRGVVIPKVRAINVKPTIKDRKYKCPHCDFTGADISNMRSHIRRHSLNKPYKCTECDKAFYTRTELSTHLRSHTGERPYLCTTCGRTFSTSSKLCHHKKRHDNIRDKECSICKMRFFDTMTLRVHMAVHSEKRKFECDLCDASFKVALALRNHKKLHENKKEYECKLCDARFNQHAGLYSHMKCCHTVVFNSSKSSSKYKAKPL